MSILFITTLVFSIILILATIFFFYYIFRAKKQFENYNRGILSFAIDRNKKRVKMIDFIPSIKQQLSFFFPKNLASGFWISIEEFVSLFDLEHDDLFINYINKLDQYNNIISFNVNLDKLSNNVKSDNINVEGNFQLIYEDENLQHCILSWTKFEEENFKNTPFITKEELLKSSSNYLGFFGFNVIQNHFENSKTIIESLTKMLKLIKFRFFYSRGVLVVVIEASSFKKLSHKVKKILDKYEKNGRKKYFLNYYANALGYVEAKNVKTEEDINKVLRRLQYSISQSIIRGEPFGFKLRNVDFIKFDEYRNDLLSYYKDVQDKNITPEYIPIFAQSNITKKISYIVKPSFKKQKNIEEILLNLNNQNLAYDAIAEKYFLKNSNYNNAFYFINDYYFLKNYENLKLSSNIFILKIIKNNSYENLFKPLRFIREKNITFGIYIDKIDEQLFTFLNKIEPNYLFISDSISSNLNYSKNILDLINLSNIIKNKKTLIIYENPNFTFNIKQRKLISFKFFYNIEIINNKFFLNNNS